MTIRLKRDSAGVISNNLTPIILRGGHYDLFQQDGHGNYALLDSHNKIYDVAYTAANAVPCSQQTLPPTVYLDRWDVDQWADLFQACDLNGINLLRVFASDGTRLNSNGDYLDLSPFQIDNNPPYGGKYKVRQAAENAGIEAQWNTAYFDRLRAFADIANQHNVCLLVTIFNSFDLGDTYNANVYAAWQGSFWNPANTNDPAWGEENLIRSKDAEGHTVLSGQRQNRFIVPDNNIHYVQYAVIKRIVRALRGRGNVIFEVMNEPRQATPQQLVDFYINMIRWIREQFETDWNPLICINDFNFDADLPGGSQSEMEYWKINRTSGYDLFDVISYHGLTATHQNGVPVCNSGNQPIALTDKASITKRFNSHRSTHPGKAIIFSSDGASITRLKHHNATAEMNITDGQISTNLTLTAPPADASLRADLQDWASWCYGFANGDPQVPGNVIGVAHFQNHSSFQRSFEKIKGVFGLNYRA